MGNNFQNWRGISLVSNENAELGFHEGSREIAIWGKLPVKTFSKDAFGLTVHRKNATYGLCHKKILERSTNAKVVNHAFWKSHWANVKSHENCWYVLQYSQNILEKKDWIIYA